MKKAFTPGTYTLPAHISFFMGQTTIYFWPWRLLRYRCHAFLIRRAKDPTEKQNSYGDCLILKHRKLQNILCKGEILSKVFVKRVTSPSGPEGWIGLILIYRRGETLLDHFERSRFFGGANNSSHTSAELQIEWVLESLPQTAKTLLSLYKFGETHHRFIYKKLPVVSWKRALRRQ